METPDYWELLRAGNAEYGLGQIKEACAQKPDASRIMELGVAYLYLRQYARASEHFLQAIRTYPRSMSCFFGMTGIATWCLGQFSEAVRHWKDGLSAGYADTAGLGIQMPLLLFTASVLKPSVFDRGSAEKILLKKAEDSRIKTWRGPLASWLLGHITESELRDYCCGHNEADTRNRHWIADFYSGILQCSKGNHESFLNTMRKLTDISRPVWSNKDFFLSRMWSEEFFFARNEVESNSTCCL